MKLRKCRCKTKCLNPQGLDNSCPLHPANWRQRQDWTKHPKAGKATEIPPAEIMKRFWPHVARSSDERCWPWLRAINKEGYGRIHINGRLLLAHRVAYAIANGRIERGTGYHGTVIRHTCDNPACCNPAHLVKGTQRENVQDMVSRNRASPIIAMRTACEPQL